MKKSQLRVLLKKIIKESRLLENLQDPTKDEMFNYLHQMYGNEEGFRDDAEVAIYWFANSFHGGQSSNLYSVLSTSRFHPGPIAKGPEPGSSEEMMYEDLVLHFAKGSEEAQEIEQKHASMNEGDESDAMDDMWAGSDDDLKAHGFKEPKTTQNKQKTKKFFGGGKSKPYPSISNNSKKHSNFDWDRVKKDIDKGTLGENIDDDADLVEYVSQRKGEEPFTLRTGNGQEKFEYVNGKYPSGKVDVAVYAFRGDIVYGYQYFRKLFNLPS